MKKALVVLVLILGLSVRDSMAQSYQPGSTQDPLVSKSYVDQQITQLVSLINDLGQAESLSSFTPVRLNPGEILLGDEGTEIIMRSGQGVGFCSTENGMVDVTAGIDIVNHSEVKINHMLIVPRGDGRGVLAKTEAWFIIKGGFSIVPLG